MKYVAAIVVILTVLSGVWTAGYFHGRSMGNAKQAPVGDGIYREQDLRWRT